MVVLGLLLDVVYLAVALAVQDYGVGFDLFHGGFCDV
jgi:hypothetical protein